MSAIPFSTVAHALDRNIDDLRRLALARNLLTKNPHDRNWFIDEGNIPLLSDLHPRRHANQRGLPAIEQTFCVVSPFQWDTIIRQLKAGKVNQRWQSKGYGGTSGRKCRTPGCRHDLHAFPAHHEGHCMQCMMFVVMPEE